MTADLALTELLEQLPVAHGVIRTYSGWLVVECNPAIVGLPNVVVLAEHPDVLEALRSPREARAW